LNIKGLVRDTKNEAIIGASITVEGTNIGVVSDINGIFMLSAPSGSILKLTYIGYKPLLKNFPC
jgi:iron complex outermembrane receptor protein